MPIYCPLKSDVSNFVAFLHNNKLVDFISIQEDNEVGFKNRFRLQKLVHIAQSRFRLPSSYFYSLYKHGPYSPSLTDDVYEMDASSIDDIDHVTYELDEAEEVNMAYKLPENFDENRFISLLSDKDEKWLEIASTLIYALDKKYREKTKIIEYVSCIKPSYSKDYIREVYSELIREKLILTVIEEMEDVIKSAPDLFEALAKDDISLIKS